MTLLSTSGLCPPALWVRWMFLFTKFVFSRGLAEAGLVRGWLDLSEEFARVTEDEAGRGFMDEGRESNEDWEN